MNTDMEQKPDKRVQADQQTIPKMPHDNRILESQQILARIKLETGSGARGALTRNLNQPPLQTGDEDPVEVWATKIGRILGLIIMLAMILWLVIYVLNL